MLMWMMAATVLPTVLICAALVIIVGLIIFSLIRDRRKGKSTCGCNCAHCAMAGACHKPKKK